MVSGLNFYGQVQVIICLWAGSHQKVWDDDKYLSCGENVRLWPQFFWPKINSVLIFDFASLLFSLLSLQLPSWTVNKKKLNKEKKALLNESMSPSNWSYQTKFINIYSRHFWPRIKWSQNSPLKILKINIIYRLKCVTTTFRRWKVLVTEV